MVAAIEAGRPPVVKYPSTRYWPWSLAEARAQDVHQDPERFVGADVVITEKLDGGNTLLHGGQVYGRSVSAPADGPWFAMVKKHHAWKVREPDVFLYGEDIYGVHSIAYGGEREGIVMRLACGFPAEEFSDNVCKSVRSGHVQTDEHWTSNWRPCRIAGRTG